MSAAVSPRVVAAVAATLVAAAAALAVVLSDREARLAGSNDVVPSSFIAQVPPRATLCQRFEDLPPRTGSLRIVAGLRDGPGPRFEAVLRDARGAAVARGGVRPGWRGGALTIPLDVRRAASEATLCLRNAGPGRVALAGLGAPAPDAARIGDVDARGRVAVAYLRPGRESWWALAGTVRARFARGRGGFLGGAAPWVAIGLALAAWAVAIAVVVRPRGPEGGEVGR